MKKKTTVYIERKKLENALYNLTRYVNFLENTSFVILFVSLLIGALIIFFGLMGNDYDLLRSGVFIVAISSAIYVFLIKPLLLIIYAVCKILVNSEKDI